MTLSGAWRALLVAGITAAGAVTPPGAWRMRLAALARSLTVQLVAFTLIVLILALIFFVLVPFQQYRPPPDPVAMTRSLASRALQEAVEAGLSSAADASDLVDIAAMNPRFYYYVRDGGEELRFGAPPRSADAPDLSVPVPFSPTAAESGRRCESYAYWNTQFTEDGVTRNVSFRQCDARETWIEYGGIDTPLARASGALTALNLRIVWSRSRDILAVALAFMVIAGAVQWVAVRSLRRVTRVARSIDLQPGRSALLPEDGIPTEAAPLVRAVNELIRGLRHSQAQQGLFLAAAAHEMRTPLAVLRTRLEDLPESEAKGELRDDVRRIVSLVEQLLRLAIIRNRDELSERVDLVEAARTVVAQRAPLGLDRGVEVGLQADVRTAPIRGDAILVEVAIANLVDNAISFSPTGERVTVAVAAGEVRVKDRGPGIPEEVRETLFEPFAKSPPNRTGHGLGLAIVAAIMKLHGGRVSVSPAASDARAGDGAARGVTAADDGAANDAAWEARAGGATGNAPVTTTFRLSFGN